MLDHTPSAAAASRRGPMSTRLQAAILALTTLLLTASALAAQGGRVELEVSDAKGKKLGGVLITIEHAEGTITGETTKKGRYQVNLPNPGAHKFTLVKDGLADHTFDVNVESGVTTTAGITMVDQALKNQQLSVEAFNEGVKLVQGGGDQATALANFQKAAELDPNQSEAFRMVALIAANLGDIDTAGKALDTYLGLDPAGLPKVAPAAYDVYRSTGMKDKLPEVRQHLVAMGANGDYAIKVFNEGVKHVKAEEHEQAIELFEEAITLDPTLAPAHRSMAALYFNDQKWDDALTHLGHLLDISPNHKEGLRLTFFANLSKGDGASARAAGEKWLAQDKGAAKQIIEQAQKLFEGNQTGDAKQYAELVVAGADDSADGHYLLGRILAAQGQAADAKSHLQKFLSLAPGHKEAEAAKQMLAGL